MATHPCAVCGGHFRRSNRRVATCSRACGIVYRGRRRAAAFERDRAAGVLPGRYIDASGYARVLVAPGKWALEHRLVMENALGRPLDPRERVHHRNGRRADNRSENLELWTLDHKDPAGVRAAERAHCPTCTCSAEKL